MRLVPRALCKKPVKGGAGIHILWKGKAKRAGLLYGTAGNFYSCKVYGKAKEPAAGIYQDRGLKQFGACKSDPAGA